MLIPIVREDLLYYLWKTKTFDMSDLHTVDGEAIELVDFGVQNHDAGPDFSNAKVKIGDTIWAGNVEMHVYSSDWERHSHDLDKAYDSVILHVVYEHDQEIHTSSERILPTLQLKERIPDDIKTNYARLINNNNWIPCEHQLANVPEHTVAFWLQRLVADRLDAKTSYLKTILANTNNDWEETLYIFLMRYMGARVNMDPFESLAKNLPLSIIRKNRDDIHTIESLLYGQAGMLLASHPDPYFQALKDEYSYLQKKYQLVHIPPVSWKFARMRPVGFPTIRIAQIAQIMHQTQHLFSQVLAATDIKTVRDLFYATPSDYWQDHYRFGKVSVQKDKSIAGSFIDLIIINVVSPTLFLYGRSVDDQMYCDRAIDLLEAIKPEKNKIINNFKALGMSIRSAADSQAAIELKSKYCDEKKCLSCRIGNALVK